MITRCHLKSVNIPPSKKLIENVSWFTNCRSSCKTNDQIYYLFGSVEELCEHQDAIIHYPYCEDMEDVARYLIEETGSLGKVPINLQNYID